MPEDVNVGRLVAEIALDSSKLESDSQRSQEALEEIRYTLQHLGTDSSETEDILKQCFSDTSKVEGYIGKMDIISAKMDNYREKLKRIQEQEANDRQYWNTLNQSGGRNSSFVSKYTDEINELNQKISEQEIRFQNVQSSMDSYVKKVVDGYRKQADAAAAAAQKQEDLNRKMSDKQVKSDMMGTMSLSTTALRNIKDVAPEVSNSLTTVIYNVHAIRSAMQQGQSAALQWGTIIVAAFGAIVNVVQNAFDEYFRKMDEATERSRAAFEAMVDNARQYTKELDELAKEEEKRLAAPAGEEAQLKAQISLYDRLRNKTWLTAEEKEQLDHVTQSLASTMGLSEIQLRDISGAYRDLTQDVETYIGKLKEQAKQEYYGEIIKESTISMERLKKPIEEAKKAWDDAETELQQKRADFFQQFGVDYEAVKEPFGNHQGGWYIYEQTQAVKEYEQKVKDAKTAWTLLKAESVEAEIKCEEATNALTGAAEKTKDSVDGVTDSINGLSAAGTSADKTADTLGNHYQNAAEKADLWKEKLTEANKILEYQKSEMSRLTQQRKEAQEALTAATNAAAAGDKEALQNLPKLQAALDTVIKKISTLSTETTVQRNLVKQLKKEYEALADAAKPLSEKMEDIAKQSSSMRSSLNSLADSMKNLEKGETLSLDTLLNLIDKYPQYSDELISAAGNADLQKKALELLFQAKKDEYILTLQASQAKILTSREETEQILSDLEKQAKAFESMGGITGKYLSGVVSGRIKELKDSLSAYDALQKRIDFIKGLSMADFGSKSSISAGSSSKEKSALQKYLDQLDDLKELGQLSLKREIASYEWALKTYSATAEEKHDVDVRLYNARNKLAEQQKKEQEDRRKAEIDALNKLGDAVTAALKNKYQQQKKLEEQRINESVESWKKWEDETVSAIQGQIDALDKLSDSYEEENKQAEYQQKRQAMKLELRYEKDSYNREQIKKQIAALDKDENERLYQLSIDTRKKELQEQQDKIKEYSSEKQKALSSEKESVTQKYDQLMSDIALQGEAKKLITGASQQELTKLINSYAPQYEMLGQKLGERLYQTISSKVSSITGLVNNIAKATDTDSERMKSAGLLETFYSGSALRAKSYSTETVKKEMEEVLKKYVSAVPAVTAYKNRVASYAGTAANRFYQSSSLSSGESGSTRSVSVNMTVNFNGQVDSPVQVKRKLQQVGYEIARQMV